MCSLTLPLWILYKYNHSLLWLLFYIIFGIWDRILLWSPGWPWPSVFLPQPSECWHHSYVPPHRGATTCEHHHTWVPPHLSCQYKFCAFLFLSCPLRYRLVLNSCVAEDDFGVQGFLLPPGVLGYSTWCHWLYLSGKQCYAVLRAEARVLCVQGKHSTTPHHF